MNIFETIILKIKNDRKGTERKVEKISFRTSSFEFIEVVKYRVLVDMKYVMR